MSRIKKKTKIWAELIELEKLEDALDDIPINISIELSDSKVYKYILKLLLYLARTADKCNKQNYITGQRIAKLTKLLCTLLLEIPDNTTFFASLYCIICCLIDMNLYEDVLDICNSLRYKNLCRPVKENNETTELLRDILRLWHIQMDDIYDTLTLESFSVENYNKLKNVIRHDMEMTQIAHKNYTEYLIMKISLHLDKIASMNEKTNAYFDDFYEFILECLIGTQLHLHNNRKYNIYNKILRMCCIVCKTIDLTHIGSTVEKFDKLFSYFEYFLTVDEECHTCFQQFRYYCTIFCTPIENLVNIVKDMENFIHNNVKLLEKYGYTGALKYNAYNIAKVNKPLFIYWEMHIKTDKQQFLDTDVLQKIMALIVDMSVFYIKNTCSKCEICINEKCTVKTSVYNSVIVNVYSNSQCIDLVSKFPAKTLSKEVCVLAREILEMNIALVQEMRERKCKQWSHLWAICSILICNMGIASEHIYEESASFFYLLCTYIFKFQEIESYFRSLSRARCIFTTLYRLSVLHCTNGMYREAMTTTALNALLIYNQSDTDAYLFTFDMWTCIKKKCASEKIAKLNILECLRNDKDKIYEMGSTIDISKYDLIQLCLCEVRSLLQEKIPFTDGVSAVLEELINLKPNNHQYALAMQLLGHYLLSSEYDSSILKYYEQAIWDLNQDKSNSMIVLCLEANLHFFTFVEELHTMNQKTQMEMENTKFALYAPKMSELRETIAPNVVSAYTMINVRKDSGLIASLQKSLMKWKELLESDIDVVVKNLEPDLILRILITASEYSRLYRYEDCEAAAWVLAYELASKIDDYSTIIYVVGRSISLRLVNYDWIATAKEYATKHRDSKNKNLISYIAIFWISLADFYFECGKLDDAKELLNEARSFPEITFLPNTAVYLLSLDTIVRNYRLYQDNISYEDYRLYVVESVKAMINLSQDLLCIKKCKNQQEYLFSYDVLFTTIVKLAMRVNSLRSPEISAHLVQCVKAAQSLGAIIRTAELLKSLCYIDLSHSKLDDCKVKLQGLEHILDIETFELSMNFKIPEKSTHLAVTPIKIIDPVRDVSQRDASPVLGKKVLDLPLFLLHANCNSLLLGKKVFDLPLLLLYTNCNCYKCNTSYQYLVFATISIRAQLYALQNHVTLAFDHFHGAFQMRQQLFEEKESVLPGNCPPNKTGIKRFFWQARSYIIDYVHMLINFSYFLKMTSRKQDAFDTANLAINICHKYKLEGHPLYLSAKLAPESPDCLELSQLDDIDISEYRVVPAVENVCLTSSGQDYKRDEPSSIRCKKNPVILNLDHVNDEKDIGVSSSPVAHSREELGPRANLARKRSLEDLSHDANSDTENSMPIQTKMFKNEDRRNA